MIETIEVTKVTEILDGSAEVELKMDEKTKKYLINYAFNDLLSKGLDGIEQLYKEEIK